MSGGTMVQFGKLLVILGGALVVAGLVLIAGSRFSFLGLGRLPGDISYQGKHGSFYFPITTCIVISVVITLVFWLISFLTRR